MIYLGIDPGVSGAVAVLHPDGRVELHDAPTRKGTSGSEFLDGEMADLLRPFEAGAFAVLEECSIRPGESGRSGLKIGKGWGMWKMALSYARIAHEVARPQAWKKAFSLPLDGSLSDSERKKASRARAQELFPAYAAELGKKRPDFAEALLLAEYGRRRAGR